MALNKSEFSVITEGEKRQFIMEIEKNTIDNMKKSNFDVTDDQDNEVNLTEIASNPKDEQYDLRVENEIVQDDMTADQVVASVNDLFAA